MAFPQKAAIRRVLLLSAVGSGAALAILLQLSPPPRPRPKPDVNRFDPRVVIRHSFPPIKDVPAVSVEEAAGKIEDSELVLGVQVGSQARAYPINMLTGPEREIINDELGGTAIAATW